jgi:glyoxylase-like metal-dependent hydrolase (beta-lactamase superfamily II)
LIAARGLIAALAALGLAGVGAAQTRPSPDAPLTAERVADGVFVVRGGVATTGFIVGRPGVIVIDTGLFPQTGRAIQAQIAKVTDEPVNVVVLTHSDPDHVNGLVAFAPGVEVIAQERVRPEMEAALAGTQRTFIPTPPDLAQHLPDHPVLARESLKRDGQPLVLIHTGPAHTDGDLIVWLPRQRIVFAGDLLTPDVGAYPGIHLEKHGSSLGWIASVEAMLKLNADIFIAGHGPPQTRDQVMARLAAARARRARIAELIAQHMTLKEIEATLGDPPPVGAAALFPTYTQVVWRELTAAPANPP